MEGFPYHVIEVSPDGYFLQMLHLFNFKVYLLGWSELLKFLLLVNYIHGNREKSILNPLYQVKYLKDQF